MPLSDQQYKNIRYSLFLIALLQLAQIIQHA